MIVDTHPGPPETAAAPPRVPRIALAHDWLVVYRGGEAVLEGLALAAAAHGQPGPFLTMFGPKAGIAPRPGRRQERHKALRDFSPVVTSWLNDLPAADRLRRWMLPLYPAAVADLSRRLARLHQQRPIDLLISTSSAAIKGLRPPPGVPHLCYCHSPARYLWSQTAEYGRGKSGRLRTLGLRAFGPALREWDARTAANVTRFLANSTHTAAEIRRCYGRDADVLHPPVDTEFYTPSPDEPRNDHWLYAGALEPYKRVDLVIEAANRDRRPLVIVGAGSQDAHLRALAGPTVRFLGRVDDEELRRQYRAAAMLVFPQVEDFGIVAVEALACGTPVLAFGAGGVLDTVTDGVTGAMFHEPAAQALLEAADRVPRADPATARACRAAAERFSEARFLQAASAHIAEMLAAGAHR